MSRGDASSWLEPSAKGAITDVVRAVESKTNAELVVMVRAAAATHRHVDLGFGALLAFLAVLGYVYLPVTFVDDLAPPAIALCFVSGVMFSNAIDALKRSLLSRSARRAAVALSARAAFVDQRIGSTRERVGVLVYLALFEREAEVLADVGIDTAKLGAPWRTAVDRIEAVARNAGTITELGAALGALGEALAIAVPKTENDVNELPDEVA